MLFIAGLTSHPIFLQKIKVISRPYKAQTRNAPQVTNAVASLGGMEGVDRLGDTIHGVTP